MSGFVHVEDYIVNSPKIKGTFGWNDGLVGGWRYGGKSKISLFGRRKEKKEEDALPPGSPNCILS